MRFFTSKNSDSHEIECVIATMPYGWTVEYDKYGLIQFHRISEDQVYPEEWLQEVEWKDTPEQNEMLSDLEMTMMKLCFNLKSYFNNDELTLK